jgi:formamidopyrimidine-DNA glycosylase
MSGQLLVVPPEKPAETHLRVRFVFADGGRELRFVDQRTFGGLFVAAGAPTCRTTSRTSRATRSTGLRRRGPSPAGCAAGVPGSSGRCSTRR